MTVTIYQAILQNYQITNRPDVRLYNVDCAAQGCSRRWRRALKEAYLGGWMAQRNRDVACQADLEILPFSFVEQNARDHGPLCASGVAISRGQGRRYNVAGLPCARSFHVAWLAARNRTPY